MITVRFFAALRELIGMDLIRVACPQPIELPGFLVQLQQALGADALAALSAPQVRIAVNQQLIEGGVILREGDEVAFLPPVSGG